MFAREMIEERILALSYDTWPGPHRAPGTKREDSHVQEHE